MRENQNGDALVVVVVILFIVAVAGGTFWAVSFSKKRSSNILHEQPSTSQAQKDSAY